MFIWQYIDTPLDEVLKIQQDFKNLIPKNMSFFQVINIDTKTFMGLDIDRPVLIQVPPNTFSQIHRDISYDASGRSLAIQIPLDNCEESTTSFWKSTSDPLLMQTKNGHFYSYYEESMCTKMTEYKLTSPVIFDSKILHNVTNPTNQIRRAISLRFKEDPWHLVKSK
jgi:hypothetical protein